MREGGKRRKEERKKGWVDANIGGQGTFVFSQRW